MIEAREKRNELFQKIDTLSPEERRAEFDALRESAEKLSEDQRRELREDFALGAAVLFGILLLGQCTGV